MIDKVGLSTINWNVHESKASDQFVEGTEQYYLNKIIRSFLTLLIDPKTAHILHRSIDNDTKLLTDIIKEIEQRSSTKEEPYGFYSLSTQTERKNDYITGKIGIGPFALNNNNHVLTMLYDVRFKRSANSIMTVLGLTDLSIKEDKDHNSIMSWLSALINAHVDIAKDPYISKLNVNPYTYNLVNTLIRTGFGKNTFYFTTQPIMKEVANAYTTASSAYMADPNKTQYQLLKEAVENIAKERFGNEKIEDMDYETLSQIADPNLIGARTIINEIFKLLVDNGILRKNANRSYEDVSGTTVLVNDKDVHLTANLVQFVVYLANLQFAPYAQSVSNLVKYSKIDTKKHGSSYIELQVFSRGFEDLFFNTDGSGLFEKAGLSRMAKDSYIETKTRNATSMTKNVLKGQFLESTRGFDHAVQTVLQSIGRSGSKDVKLHKKIARILSAAIKSEFINDYAKQIRPNNSTYIRDLVSESEESFEYSQQAGSNRIRLNKDSNYDLTSYIGGNAEVSFVGKKSDKILIGTVMSGSTVINVVDNQDGTATYTMRCPILGADNQTNELIIPIKRNADTENNKVRITGGKNTIYDRFNRLAVLLRNNPEYSDILDGAGEPINMLLRNMVIGKEYNYTAPVNNYLQESPDTYPTLKFVKLFNALDQNGIISNYIIDGWDELLHDHRHPLLKEFAEDLVVYAFVTSGDQQGFTKMAKQVPYSWRKESGYGEFIRQKIADLQVSDIDEELLSDAILNNWFDNDVVRTMYPTHTNVIDGKSQIPNFVTYSGETSSRAFAPQYNPLILAALKYNEETGKHEPSIDPNDAPLFIKVPRRREQNAKDSQRRYTVYKRFDFGMKQAEDGLWITYPIYAKVEPKGNSLSDGYLVTEYGRDDSTSPERTANVESLQTIYKLGDFISRQVIDRMRDNFGDRFADIVESLNYKDVFESVYDSSLYKFLGALDDITDNSTELQQELAPTLEEDFELSEEEQEEAKKYKDACEGGKI